MNKYRGFCGPFLSYSTCRWYSMTKTSLDLWQQQPPLQNQSPPPPHLTFAHPDSRVTNKEWFTWMRVLGKPLTETAPGRLEWLRWVGPLRSNCLLRLNKTYKGETVTTTSTTTEGNNNSCTSPCVVKCFRSHVRWPFLTLFCPALYCHIQSPFLLLAVKLQH